jgi:hypothetical protein
MWRDKNVPMYLYAWHVLKTLKKNFISKVPKNGKFEGLHLPSFEGHHVQVY